MLLGNDNSNEPYVPKNALEKILADQLIKMTKEQELAIKLKSLMSSKQLEIVGKDRNYHAGFQDLSLAYQNKKKRESIKAKGQGIVQNINEVLK